MLYNSNAYYMRVKNKELYLYKGVVIMFEVTIYKGYEVARRILVPSLDKAHEIECALSSCNTVVTTVNKITEEEDDIMVVFTAKVYFYDGVMNHVEFGMGEEALPTEVRTDGDSVIVWLSENSRCTPDGFKQFKETAKRSSTVEDYFKK